jgi:putative peptide zinc metalloprotease protein
VRDPAGNQFHRLSDAAYRFVGLLDGSRTVGEAWELVGGQLDDEAPTQPEVIQILSQLHAANLLEADVSADANVLLRRHKMQMKRKLQGRLMNVLFPRIPIWDPDSFLVRWMPIARMIFSKVGAIIWLIVVGAAVAMIVPRWDEVSKSAAVSVNPNNWIYLWAVFVLIKFIHELGHAFACRRFGGECHEMGIMFLVFIPTPYVDASSAWAFPSRWHRMFVGAAGMIVELFVASLCAFAWLQMSEVPLAGIPVRQLLYNAMLIASVSTVIFNANPLLRYDGYYMLSDFLEIPNLQQKSKEYLLGLIKRHVFRVKSQQPLPPISQRLWLFFYGIASTCYRVFVGIMIILVVGYQVPILGWLMALGGVVTWVIMPVVMLFKYLALEPELHRKRPRAVVFTLAVTAAIVVLLGFIPWWVRVESTGILEAEQHDLLHARAGGFVKQIAKHDGDWVKKDDVLLVCADPELDAQILQTEAQLRGLHAQANMSRVSDPAQWKQDLEDIQVYEATLAKLTRQKNELTIRAPFDGQLIAPEVHQWQGRYLQKGQELFTVATMDKLLVRAALEQTEAQLVSSKANDAGALNLNYGQPEIRVAGDLQTIARGNTARIVGFSAQEYVPHQALTHMGGADIPNDPSDPKGQKPEQRQFELQVKLPNPQEHYVAGQRAYIRLTVDRKPLAWQWFRKFMQLIESREKTGSKLV